MHLLRFWVILLLVISTTTVFGGEQATETDSISLSKKSIVVSILPLEFFVEKIGGGCFETYVLVGPGQSPATFEPTTKQLAILKKASTWFTIGMPFEKALIKKLSQTTPQLKRIDLSDGLLLHEFKVEHGDENHHHVAGELDPHSWLDPANGRRIAISVATTLVQNSPDDSLLFLENLKNLIARLDEVEAEIRAILKPLKSRDFYVFHPAFGYFGRAFGMRQIPIEMDGKEPSARHLARIIDHARSDNIRTVFVQPQNSDKAAHAIADAIGGTVIEIDPLALDYPENLLKIARALSDSQQSTGE